MPLYEIAPWLEGRETPALSKRTAAARDVAELERWLQRFPPPVEPERRESDRRPREAEIAEAELEPVDVPA